MLDVVVGNGAKDQSNEVERVLIQLLLHSFIVSPLFLEI